MSLPTTIVCETRNQVQEENWKNHKYMEIKLHAAEELLSQQRNQREH